MAEAYEILHEDEDILVVNKAAGILVHPAPGHEGELSLCEMLSDYYPPMRDVGSTERSGVVHRLDQETSGVMVFAKNRQSYLKLREQFESHEMVRKTYLAIVHGTMKPARGTSNIPIKGKRAITHWEVLQKAVAMSMVEFKIETGRTHQIRIHASEVGHPILGDKLYGDKRKDASVRPRPQRLLLHAVELSFLHPKNMKRVVFAAPPPEDML